MTTYIIVTNVLFFVAAAFITILLKIALKVVGMREAKSVFFKALLNIFDKILLAGVVYAFFNKQIDNLIFCAVALVCWQIMSRLDEENKQK